MKWLNINTVSGIIRNLLAFGGGILVGKGVVTPDQLTSLSAHLTDPTFLGAMAALCSGVWSVFAKHPSQTGVTTTTTVAAATTK